MKKPKKVIEAELVLEAKKAEFSAAESALSRAKEDLFSAHAAVRQAQVDADALLPQVKIVTIKWRSGIESACINAVIVRRTPGGMLVVRRTGDPADIEFKFKWGEHSGRYRQAEKGSYVSDTRELRDVPAEYLPNLEATQ